MARIVFFLLLGIGIYLFIRNYSRRSQDPKSSNPKPPSRDTVKCAQCQTYIPGDEAVEMHGQVFCCQQHARDWKPSNK